MLKILNKNYYSLVSIPTVILYFYVVLKTIDFGPILSTLLSNLVIIIGVSLIFILDKYLAKIPNYINVDKLRSNTLFVKYSYFLIILLWIFGQFVFLWFYKNIGDDVYSSRYGASFVGGSDILYVL